MIHISSCCSYRISTNESTILEIHLAVLKVWSYHESRGTTDNVEVATLCCLRIELCARLSTVPLSVTKEPSICTIRASILHCRNSSELHHLILAR